MSVRVPPSGTRGLRLPRFFARLGNGMMLRSFRKGGARTQGGVETLMLETVGAKTGQVRQSILGYLPDGDDAWLVIASLAGTARNPAWLHNLAAQPEATIQLKDGRRIGVQPKRSKGPISPPPGSASSGRRRSTRSTAPRPTARSRSFASAAVDLSEGPRTLASRLRTAADALVAVIEPIDDEHWHRVPDPGTWSIGKEAEHVAEAAGYHQWIVRLTIGQKVSSRRPVLERRQMTSALSPARGRRADPSADRGRRAAAR